MELVSIFKKVIIDPAMSWVLFKHGTCVMLLHPQEDIRTQAISILNEHGPVITGTPSGDFEVTKVPEVNGWIVTGDSPGIMIYISEAETGSKNSDFEIGMTGRSKRESDAKELEVIHVEDKRTNKRGKLY